MNLVAKLRRTAAIAAKEFLQLGRDRLTLDMVVGIPLVQMMIFGYGINYDVRHVHAAVADQANTQASRQLIAAIAATQTVDFTERVAGPEGLRALLAQGRVQAALFIPPDFERRRLDTDRPVAQLLVDSSQPGVESVLRALRDLPLASRTGVAPPPRPWVEVQNEYNPERRTAVQIVPGLIGVILNMTMVVFTAVALVRERERGNLELLIATPVRRLELMVGKLVPYVLVGLIQTTIVLVVGVLLFDVPLNGSLPDLYLGAGLFIAATLALGLVISTLAATQFQAMQLGFFTLLPSILLSGFAFPFDGMPRPVQVFAQLLPLTHFIDVVRGVVLRGAALASMWRPLLKLTAFLVAAVLLATLRFRKRLD